MRNLLLTLLHLAVVAARLRGPGGVRAVIAENLLLKQPLIVLWRARRRAPNLTRSDRRLCGFESLFLNPSRIRTLAIALRPSTLLAFHQALVRRKYRLLFSSRPCPKKPGPKGPDEGVIRAIVELKSRNPRFGCPRTHASSRRRSGSTSTRTSCSACWPNTIALRRAALDPPGCRSSAIRQTASGAWISFAASRSCSAATGYSSSWISSRAASLAPASIAAPSPEVTSAGCLTRPFRGRAFPDLSVPITIRCSKHTAGRRTFGFWRLTTSRPCRMCRCPTHLWNG